MLRHPPGTEPSSHLLFRVTDGEDEGKLNSSPQQLGKGK